MMLVKNPHRARLSLERLELRDVPSIAHLDALHPRRFAVASGPGQTAQVSVYESGSNALLSTFQPFGTTYTGGVSIATADLTGDGIDDVVVSAIAGSSKVALFDGASRKVVSEFETFAGGTTGAFVALGDVTGDGRIDLIAGGANAIRIFRGQDLWKSQAKVAAEFQPFGSSFSGGVRVAVGDLNGDGLADIVAAPGAGGPAVVHTYTSTAAWGDTAPSIYRSKLATISVGGISDKGGVFVSAGDFNGDGKADIAVGRVVANRATVSVYQGDKPKNRLFQAFGFTATEPGGVPLALRDLDGDGRAELIAGGGAGVSQVRVLSPYGGLARSFMAFPPNYRGGVFVG